MSTSSQSIFRMIEKGEEIRILLADSEEYDFEKRIVCPVHICFSDSSCFPYRKETAHHKKVSDEPELMVNQRQRMIYLLDCPKVRGTKCKLQNANDYLLKSGEDYYAFAQVK